MLVETRPQRLYASHHQFYIADDAPFRYIAPGNYPGAPTEADLWNRQTYDDRIAPITGMLGVGTGSYGYVKVITEIHSVRPDLHLDQWDHVTESSLDARTGHLLVIGCMDMKGERFQVTPGCYRVRCCHANLAGSKDSGEGEDWYRVQIWPGEPAPVEVLKRATRPGSYPAPPPAPTVSLQPSTGGDPELTIGPAKMTARAITLRRLIAIAYAIYPAQEYPLDHILGPSALDTGRYDVSATGTGWSNELRKVLSEHFQWRFDMVMRAPAPGRPGQDASSLYYLAIRDIRSPEPPNPSLRRR